MSYIVLVEGETGDQTMCPEDVANEFLNKHKYMKDWVYEDRSIECCETIEDLEDFFIYVLRRQ